MAQNLERWRQFGFYFFSVLMLSIVLNDFITGSRLSVFSLHIGRRQAKTNIITPQKKNCVQKEQTKQQNDNKHCANRKTEKAKKKEK